MKLAVSAAVVFSLFAFGNTGWCEQNGGQQGPDYAAASADRVGAFKASRAAPSKHTPSCSGDIVIDASECGSTLTIADKIVGKCLTNSSPAFSALVKMCKRNNEENQKLNPSWSASDFPDCDGPIRTGGTIAGDSKNPKLLGFIIASKKKSVLGISYQKWVKGGDSVDSDVRSFCDAREMVDPNELVQDLTRVTGSENPQEAQNPAKAVAPDRYGEDQGSQSGSGRNRSADH